MKTLINSYLLVFMLLISVYSYSQEVFNAIQENNMEQLKTLVAEDPSLVDFHGGEQSLTPLHFAAYLDRTDMVQFLIDKGADANSLNSYNSVPLIWACDPGNYDAAEILIAHGANIHAKDDFGRTALHYVALRANEKVARLLIEHGANIHEEDDEHKMPIHMAAQNGNVEVAKVLLEHGAIVNAIDEHARTPLFSASWGGYLDMVKLLIDNGAVVDARYIGAASPLTTAAVADNTEVCKYLIEQNANINLVCNMLVTPIYPFILNNNIEMVDYLLERKAKVNYRDLAGRTPLYVAIRDGYFEITQKLIEHGADPFVIDETNGRNLLHLAASNGRKEIARLLIDKQLPVNAKDRDGFTPLDYAIKHHNREVMELLQSEGAQSAFYSSTALNSFITSPTREKEAYIIKLRHKTWAVKTQAGMLVFDHEESGKLPPVPSLANGCLTPDELKNTTLYHFDGAMDSDKVLYDREKEYETVHFICSDIYRSGYQRSRPFEVQNIHFPERLKPQRIQNVEVTSLPAFGAYRRSYLVNANGLNILWLYRHSDRYYPWIDNTEAIEYLKKSGISIDLLFVGNPAADMGPEWVNIMEKEYEITKNLDVRAVFPIPSCKMGEYFYHERKRKGDGENIYYARNPGDVFHYIDNKVIRID